MMGGGADSDSSFMGSSHSISLKEEKVVEKKNFQIFFKYFISLLNLKIYRMRKKYYKFLL